MATSTLRNKVLTPGSLTMRESSCFYCGSDDHCDYMVEDFIGIRSCPQHKQWAVRDCRAYCRERGTIPLSWVQNNEAIAGLLTFLKAGAKVKRSSGKLEEWILAPSKYREKPYIFRYDEDCTLPMVARDGSASKPVFIHQLRELNPQIDPELCNKASKFLLELYKTDLEDHLAAQT